MPADRGHYESFYIKACHPDQPLAVWIRYTAHKRPGARPNGSLWVTLFDGAAQGPRAHKATLPEPRAGGADWIAVGEAAMRPGVAVGAIDGAEWELRFASSEAPLYHLPRSWMYRTPLPRTKLLSPAPDARFDGSLKIDGRVLSSTGWRGMVGHNWGAQHAERWIWLHGLTEAGDWLDAAIGRIKIGRFTTPWVASGAVSMGGRRDQLGGPGRKIQVSESPDRCDFTSAAGACASRHRRGAAQGLRRVRLRRPGRARAPHRQLLDRRHARGGRAQRRPGDASWSCAAGRHTSWACASATTASRSSRSRTAEGTQGARSASPRRSGR